MAKLKNLGPTGQGNVEMAKISRASNGWTISGEVETGKGNVRLQRLEGSSRFLIVSWPEPAIKDTIQGKKIVTLT